MSVTRAAPPGWAFWHRPQWRSLEWDRIITLSLFGLLVLYVLTVFREYGISNDEEVQHVYGQLLYRFYASGFSDQAAFDYKNLYLYGGFFDLLAAVLEQCFPSADIWNLRHLLSAAFGLSGLYACWKLARTLGGEKAGIVATVMLALTGAWIGGMFTHTKDVPFATCMTWALYYTVRMAPYLPRPPLRLVLKFGVAVGCALGLRVGAVFAVFYLVATVFAAALLIPQGGIGPRLAFLGRSVLHLLPGAIPAIALTALFWPWAMMGPDNLIHAATAFSHFTFQMFTIVDGEVLPIGDVPPTYLHQYLLVRLPILTLLGLGCAVYASARAAFHLPADRTARSTRLLHLFPLALATLFPLGFALLADPTLYNGVRHFTFVVPPLAVASAIGLRHVWHGCLHRHGREAALVLIVALLMGDHLFTLIRLHPYEYVFYNRLAGGLPGAARKWELDYWSSSLREASEQLNDYVEKEGNPDHRTYLVAVCAEPIQAEAYLAPGLDVTTDWRRADFFLSSTQMNCHEALKGQIVGTVSRMGVTLAVIRDRRALEGADREPRRP